MQNGQMNKLLQDERISSDWQTNAQGLKEIESM